MIFAGVIISLIVSLIPIAFIIVFRNSNISNYFLLKGIVNLFIILNLSNLIYIVIGASIGILFRKWISIVVSLLIYSFFPLNLFNPVAQSNVDTFYCNNHEINLTDSFLWYPYINNKDFPINYTIKTNSLSTIYSNLDTKVEGNEYLLEGIAQTVSLFSGQYRDVFDEGIEYIIPSSYNLDNLKMNVGKS